MLKREEILKMFETAGAIRHGHFELSSGRHSGTYVQCALVLRHPADQPSIGLWPAPGLATITALTQNPAGAPRGQFQRLDYGCTQEKNLPHEAGQPPLPRRALRAELADVHGQRATGLAGIEN